jgi:hypothetical protein
MGAIPYVDLRAADTSAQNIAKLKSLPSLELYRGNAIDGQLVGSYPRCDAAVISIYTGQRIIIAATVGEVNHRRHNSIKFPSQLGDYFDDCAFLITRPEVEIPGHKGCHLIKMYYVPYPDYPIQEGPTAGEFYFTKGEIVYVVFGTDGSFVSVAPAKTFPTEGQIESEQTNGPVNPKVITTMPPKDP